MTAPRASLRPTLSYRRRYRNAMLRWQGRLESPVADRVIPWGFALGITVLLFSLSWAQFRSLASPPSLAAYKQAAWLISHGHRAEITINDSHLLAAHFPLAFYPLAALTRVLPRTQTLLFVQAAAIGLGAVPLWILARKEALLRPGAALVVLAVYAFAPPLHNLALDGFHPEAVAIAPLLAAACCLIRRRHRLFLLFAVLAMAWDADIGLVIAGLGLLMVLDGRRRIGTVSIVLGVGWWLLAVTVFEPHYGSGGFVSPDAFGRYGDSFWDIAWGMVTHPQWLVSDAGSQGSVRLVVAVLAPLLFLPVLVPRLLLPALPLQLLLLVAAVPHDGPAGAPFGLPLVVFSFVALVFALARLGRVGVERVAVDRRVLLALLIATMAFFCLDASTSPYAHPWDWGHQDAADGARREAVAMLGRRVPVRASTSVLGLVADRPMAATLTTAESPAGATAGVDAVIADSNDWDTPADFTIFKRGLLQLQFQQAYSGGGIELWVRAGVATLSTTPRTA